MPDLAERFEAAVSALVGEGSVKDRLLAAYSEHLDGLETSELPRELRTTFEHLHMALHAVESTGGQSCLRASIRKMSMQHAGNHARTIVSLYAKLLCRGERAEPLKVVNGRREFIVP